MDAISKMDTITQEYELLRILLKLKKERFFPGYDDMLESHKRVALQAIRYNISDMLDDIFDVQDVPK